MASFGIVVFRGPARSEAMVVGGSLKSNRGPELAGSDNVHEADFFFVKLEKHPVGFERDPEQRRCVAVVALPASGQNCKAFTKAVEVVSEPVSPSKAKLDGSKNLAARRNF
jgi:hypothetical protein